MTDLEKVRKNGLSLKGIICQTHEICLEAVKEEAYALKYVENQTPEVCLEAVKKDGFSLKFVKNQTPEICLEALKNHWYKTIYDLINKEIKEEKEFNDGFMYLLLTNGPLVQTQFDSWLI